MRYSGTRLTRSPLLGNEQIAAESPPLLLWWADLRAAEAQTPNSLQRTAALGSDHDTPRHRPSAAAAPQTFTFFKIIVFLDRLIRHGVFSRPVSFMCLFGFPICDVLKAHADILRHVFTNNLLFFLTFSSKFTRFFFNDLEDYGPLKISADIFIWTILFFNHKLRCQEDAHEIKIWSVILH